MNDETLVKVQNQLLIIVKEIKRVCDENNIRYFLVGGTLIGAIRHKGFIPWDDDLDIGMMRSDYNKFLKIAPQKLGKDFFLQTWKNDKEYAHAFAKVRMKGTIYRESNDNTLKKNQGFFVDIFPYDNIPDDLKERKHFSNMIMMYRCTMHVKGKMKPWNNIQDKRKKIRVFMTYLPFRLIAFFVDRYTLIKKYSLLMNKYNGDKTTHICQESGGARFGKYPIKREYLSSCIELPFEDDTFSCPKYYDEFLHDIYGDYMKLPPIEQQKCTHGVFEIKFKED